MASVKDVARFFEYLSLKYDKVPIKKTRLNKLLYFAQGHTLAELGRELFLNQIDAWEHGPVVAVVFAGFKNIVSQAENNGIAGVQLSPEEIDIIISVWEQYHKYTATDLVKLTHKEGTPWSLTYKPSAKKNNHIPQDLIKQYFLQPENNLKSSLDCIQNIPVVDVLPADEYYPEEDSIWEALLKDAH